MNKPASPRRWFQGWRPAPRPAEDDPADYGTAFGLDLSLPAESPVAVTPAAKRPGWVQRMAERRKSGA